MPRQQQSGPWGSCRERWATFSITLAFSLTLHPPQKMAAAQIQHTSTALTLVLLLLVPRQALSELLWASPCLLPPWVPRCWPKALQTRCLGSASLYPGWFESQNNGNYITALPPSSFPKLSPSLGWKSHSYCGETEPSYTQHFVTADVGSIS